MNEVLGGLLLAHHPVGQRVGRTGVALVEHGERARVTLYDRGDQLLVSQEQILSSQIRHAPILRYIPHAGSPRRPALRPKRCWCAARRASSDNAIEGKSLVVLQTCTPPNYEKRLIFQGELVKKNA